MREAEVDAGRATGNDVGKRSTRAAGHGPAERAMARIEEEVAIARPADQGRVDRKSTRLNSSHTVIYTLSLHDALPICRQALDPSRRPWSSRACHGPY